MSALFPAGTTQDFSTQDNQPSTSKQVKNEDSEDVEKPVYNSWVLAKNAKEEAMKQEREKINAKKEEKKDKAAVRRFNLGDTSSEDECTMIVDRSESEDDDTRKIYAAQEKARAKVDQLEERKRKNREKINSKYTDISKDVRKRERKSSSSSSDSSHRRDRKKRKKEKERDKYIEPEKPKYSSKSSNWHHLATVGVTVNNPNSYMMDERKPDPLLKAVDKTLTRELSQYDQRFTAVLGAPYKINKLFFPAKTASRTSRVFDKPIILARDPEYGFVSFPFVPGESVRLSTVRCDKQIAKTEEPTPENLQARAEKDAANLKIAMESDPLLRKKDREDKLTQLRADRARANASLRDNPKNEVLWMEFLSLEDQICKLDSNVSNITDERKESILKTALTSLPKSATLTVELMKLKKKMNKPIEELNTEWKMILNRLPNSIALWTHRISEMRNDSKQFNRIDWIEVVKQATSELKGILSGQIKSHKPEEGTAEFLITLIVLRVRMELAMGFIERAVSTVQVLLETSVFSPPMNVMNQFLSFPKVWEDNLPLVGEPNGRGWFHYNHNHNIPLSSEWLVEIKEAAEKYTKDELTELGRAAEKEQQMVIFARHERIHEKYYWRPIRAEVCDTEGDLERQVGLSDIPIELFPPQSHVHLVVNLVKELGGLFYGRMLHDVNGRGIAFDDPIGHRLFSFGLFNPSLHSVPVGLPQFIDRILEQMSFDDPQRLWNQAIAMSLARIRTHAWFIAQRDSPFDISSVLKELMTTASSAVSTWIKRTPDENHEMTALTFIMCIYETLNLFQVHSEGMNQRAMDKAVKSAVKTIISKAHVFSDSKPLNLIYSECKKSIILVLATLLVRLPGSWEDRKHRVQCVILGKDAKTSELTLPEQMEAQTIIEIIRKKGIIPPGQNRIHHTLVDFFGSDFVLTSVIESLFLFSAAAKSGTRTHLRGKIESIFKNVYELADNEHYELFYSYYVTILRYGKNDFRDYYFRAIYNNNCPTNVVVVQEYIKSQQIAIREVSMLADLKKKVDDEPSIFNSLVRLYAHRRQFSRVVASAEMHSDLSIANRVVKVYIDEAKRQKDPLLWRYALNLAAEFKNPKLGEEIFTQAFADCSWSRDLHLDYIEAFPAEGVSQLLPMNEKHIRIRGDPSDVSIYIEHAKSADERQLDEQTR